MLCFNNSSVSPRYYVAFHTMHPIIVLPYCVQLFSTDSMLCDDMYELQLNVMILYIIY